MRPSAGHTAQLQRAPAPKHPIALVHKTLQAMTSAEAFLLPFHWEDVVLDPDLRSKHPARGPVAPRYAVSVDAFDLSDPDMVQSAVALASGHVSDHAANALLIPEDVAENENIQCLDSLAGVDGDQSLSWWLAPLSDRAAAQLRALLWCIHHWCGLNDFSIRAQLFTCVQHGIKQALHVMRNAARAELSADPANRTGTDTWRSILRLVAFVSAHWLQAVERELAEDAVALSLPLAGTSGGSRVTRLESSSARTGTNQGGTPARCRAKRPNLRKKTSRFIVESDASDEESPAYAEDQATVCTGDLPGEREHAGPENSWAELYEGERERLLEAFGELLRQEGIIKLAFPSAIPEDAYLYLFVRTSCALLESRLVCRKERARALLVDLIVECLSRYGQAGRLCPILVHSLQRYEHVAPVLVDIVVVLCQDNADSGNTQRRSGSNTRDALQESLTRGDVPALSVSQAGRDDCIRDLMTQVTQIPISELARDNTCARHVARFLTELAERSPGTLVPYFAAWIPHFDGEAYSVRNALVQAFGCVLKHLAEHRSPEAVQAPHQGPHDESMTLQERLLQLLLRRLDDVHALARSRTLQVWQQLIEARCVPVSLYATLAAQVAQRLQDKSMHVRRAALQLIAVAIRLNPFADRLQPALFIQRQAQCLRIAPDDPASTFEMPFALAQEGASFYAGAATFAEILNKAIPLVSRLCRSRQNGDVLDAIRVLCTAYQFEVPAAVVEAPKQTLRLGLSREESVQTAALDAFYTMCFVLPLEQVLRSTKQQQDMALATEALQTMGVLAITRSLVSLVARATVGELTCFERLLPALYRSERLAPSVLQCWWDVLAGRIPGANLELIRGCTFLIQCVVSAKPLTKSQCELLREHAFTDLVTARWACAALTHGLAAQSLDPEDGLLVGKVEALLVDDTRSVYWPAAAQAAVTCLFHCSRDPSQSVHRVLQRLVERHQVAQQQARGSQGSTAHGDVHQDKPQVRCASSWLSRLFTVGSAFAVHQLHFAVKSVRACLRSESSTNPVESCLAEAVAQLQLDDASKQVEATLTTPATGQARRARQSHSKAAASVTEASVAHVGIDPERLQYLESRLDQLCSVLETELTAPEAPLAALAPLAAHVLLRACAWTPQSQSQSQSQPAASLEDDSSVTAAQTPVHGARVQPRSSADNTLGAAAALCLGRLACLHESVAERFLRVLFTALQQASSAVVRINIVVALGDLVARFPNRLEPWTDQLYTVLRQDQDARVRRYMLMVLTHLILNEMIKIKGHWVDLVRCLQDSDASVARLARTLFTEMQRKRVSAAQTFMLLLPDLVCSLSQEEEAEEAAATLVSGHAPSRLTKPKALQPSISTEAFLDMMQFLLSFVRQERLTEHLLERFCYRLRGAADVHTAQRLALCLPLLHCTSERCLRRLVELSKCYTHWLADGVVAEALSHVLARVQRAAKRPEQRELVQAFAQCLARGAHVDQGVGCHGISTGDNDDDDDKGGTAAAAAAAAAATMTTPARVPQHLSNSNSSRLSMLRSPDADSPVLWTPGAPTATTRAISASTSTPKNAAGVPGSAALCTPGSGWRTPASARQLARARARTAMQQLLQEHLHHHHNHNHRSHSRKQQQNSTKLERSPSFDQVTPERGRSTSRRRRRRCAGSPGASIRSP